MQGMHFQKVCDEVARQAAASRDVIVPWPQLSYATGDVPGGGLLTIHGDGPRAVPQTYEVTRYSRGQLADALKIPRTYFEMCRAEQPDLLDRNVNTWLRAKSGEKQMVRCLDGKARAVLSAKYRRIDNWEVMRYLIPMIEQLNEQTPLRFAAINLSEQKLYIKLLAPSIQCEVAPGDVIQTGVVISNSEIGAGCLWVAPLVLRLVCANGLIVPDATFKKYHVGRAAMHIDENVLTEETLRAENHALLLTLRDVIRECFTLAKLKEHASRMTKLLGMPIMGGDPVASVEVLANRFLLSQQERTGIVRELLQGPHLSAFGLLNAVTAFAHKGDHDFDRAVELELIGGEMMSMSDEHWKPMLAGATQGKRTKRSAAQVAGA